MAEDKPDFDAICPACGELLKVSDVKSLLIALHQMNWCQATEGLLHA